jgi:hypothetical protein
MEERMNRMGEQMEQAGEGAASWVADFADWLMAPPFLPKETRRHLYAARREALLAMRSMLDRAVERTEDRERRAEGHTATKIDVE